MERPRIILRKRFNGAEDLMAEDGRHSCSHVFALVNHNVAPADASADHFDQGFIRAGNRNRDITQFEIKPVF